MRKFTSLLIVLFLVFSSISFAIASSDNKVMDDVAQAYVVDVKDQGSYFSYEMITGEQVNTYFSHNKSVQVKAGDFVSFKAKGDRIVDFKEKLQVRSSNEKIMAKDMEAGTLELEITGNVKLADPYNVYQIIDGKAVRSSLSNVYVGAENISVFYNEAGEVFLVLINGKSPVNNMRVGINTAGFVSLEHNQFDVTSDHGLTLVDKKAGKTFRIEPNAVATFVSTLAGTKVTINGNDLYSSPNRLYVYPVDETAKIYVMSFKRAYGYPGYRGFFEITPSRVTGKLNIINEVQLEKYLYQVVPSEMPASFGLEALKAQSVAARTYALSDYYSNRYAKRGFHVDDSTMSQVYNNSAENDLTNRAVDETKGIVMESNGELVDARYYSTSAGYGAAKHEVWADSGTNKFPGTPIPYLAAKSYTFDPNDNTKMLAIDTTSEEELSKFYKNLSYTGYDSESYYFRWKVTFSKTELENTINANIKARYEADPNFILTKDENGQFVSRPIPENGIGAIRNLYVTKRGAGGNMMELVIESSTGTYKIVKEFNIRFTIRPSNTYTGGADILLYRAKGGSTTYDPRYTQKNYSILPSAFATFDISKDENGNLASVTFYGGGNGHGVGMSQYGASSLGARGWTYDRILNEYYTGMQLVNVYEQ